MFFFGRYEHNIDAKGRLTIPSAFRELLPGGVYLTQGFDGNLTVYSKEKIDNIANAADRISITDPEGRKLRQFVFGHSFKLDFDSAGRILIPTYLKKFAGLEIAVIIIGAGASFEIWSPERWEKHSAAFNDPESNANLWRNLEVIT